MSLAARIGGREPGHMEAAEVMSRQPGDDRSVVPIRRFAVIVGEPADRGSANRIEDPARLQRLWLLLQATHDQLAGTALPPEGMPGLPRQLRVFRRELDRVVSPPLAAELRRLLPPQDAEPSASMVRIECAALATWVSGLVLQMLAASVAARAGATGQRGARPGLRLCRRGARAGGPSPLARRRPPPRC
jgi:hypothetical protein